MYTIKEAAARTGVPEASLRAWERRYHVVEPHRTASGYRLYDDRAIAVLTAMRWLVDDGWSPATAAAAIGENGPESVLGRAARDAMARADRRRRRDAGIPAEADLPLGRRSRSPSSLPEGPALTEAFVAAAAALDAAALESVLDQGFTLGRFEFVVDHWLMPTMVAVGRSWAEGRLDPSGEHAASYAVMRRLGQSFAAASSVTDGPRVLVGLPSGSRHEIGALAFATAARRRGLVVVYLGADLPLASWRRAVEAFAAEIAVLAVPTSGDKPTAVETARALLDLGPGLAVAAGGSHAADLPAEVIRLPASISAASRAVERLRR